MNKQNNSVSYYIAFMGIAIALILALSYFDSIISAAVPVAGFRLGLANTVIIAVLLVRGVGSGLTLSVMRSAFRVLTGGLTAGIMSFAGGIISYIVSAIMLKKTKCSLRFCCIISAIIHTAGQMAAACFLTGTIKTMLYSLILIPVSIATGFMTGVVTEGIVKLKKYYH